MPRPITISPVQNSRYWTYSFLIYHAAEVTWWGDSLDINRLSRGLVYATKAEAQAAADAINSAFKQAKESK